MFFWIQGQHHQRSHVILGRHFGCRPLDPTLDIWSNFVKKKAFYLLFFFCYFFLKKTQLFIKVLHIFSNQLSAWLSTRLPNPLYPGYLMLPNLTNQVIKLSKCRPLVRMTFGPFFIGLTRKRTRRHDNFQSAEKLRV